MTRTAEGFARGSANGVVTMFRADEPRLYHPRVCAREQA